MLGGVTTPWLSYSWRSLVKNPRTTSLGSPTCAPGTHLPPNRICRLARPVLAAPAQKHRRRGGPCSKTRRSPVCLACGVGAAAGAPAERRAAEGDGGLACARYLGGPEPEPDLRLRFSAGVEVLVAFVCGADAVCDIVQVLGVAACA